MNLELNGVYTGKETDLIGLHVKLRRCRGNTVYCMNPNCTKVFVRFDDPDMPMHTQQLRELTRGYTQFEEDEFAIEDPESPLAPQNGV